MFINDSAYIDIVSSFRKISRADLIIQIMRSYKANFLSIPKKMNPTQFAQAFRLQVSGRSDAMTLKYSSSIN